MLNMEKECDEDILVTGIGGRLPECENIEEFMDALLNGVDLVTETDRRHPPGIYGIPRRSGTLINVDKFDNMFFGVPPRQVSSLDPRHRIILETTYECIVDAGFNPKELRGSRTGVYIAIGYCNSAMKREAIIGTGPQGILASLAATRISFLFDFQGPSLIFDTACSSSFAALVHAFQDLQSGIIDQAIVGGANLMFEPYETLEFFRYNVLAPDGRCKVFCSNRDGYVRSEAIVSMFLQKRKDARRIFMKILGAKMNTDGFSPRGLGTPRCEIQLKLVKEIYEELNISPDDTCYFEIHGTGTPLGDEVECETVARMFQGRKKPLLIGSLKSNMGHAEIAAGFTQLIKLATMSQKGKIAPNLYLEDLDKKLSGIKEGTLKVLQKAEPLPPGLVSVNSFGFGGTNTHAVVDIYRTNKQYVYKRPKHRLVCFSGRTSEAVDFGLKKILNNQDDDEFLALVDEIHKMNIDGHYYRGYIVLGDNPVKEITKYTNPRPVWFIYCGMGCQRKAMGRDLLKIGVFRETFDRCANALKPYDIDLYEVVTKDDDSIFKDSRNVYVGIVAIQLGLTDVLRSFGIVPDGMAGHSLGEVGCGYCDGSVTTEQAILLAYARGKSLTDERKRIVNGQMVAVGMSAKEISKYLPEGIYVACQNSSTSVTVSGPEKETRAFTEELKALGIFAKNVDSNNFPMHSKYLEPIHHNYRIFVQNTIPEPVLRSSKWISTSVPENEQPPVWAKFNCAEYHFNNFTQPVLFDQVYKYIPENAIIVEIGPHGLMSPILKRELGPNVSLISLADRNSSDNEQFLLSGIGKIFNAGQQPQLRKFYPNVTFPVSRETNLISSLVKWDHSVSWELPFLKPQEVFAGTVTINLRNPEYSYLEGQNIGGRCIMPGMGYVVILWKLLAEHCFLKNHFELPIVAEHISFKRSVVISKDEDTELFVNISKKSGQFDIFESGEIVVTGIIRGYDKLPTEISKPNFDCSNLILKGRDLYKEYGFRKQIFNDCFKSIVECDIEGRNGRLEWKEDMGSFLECMTQLMLCQFSNLRCVILQTYVERITIDPVVFFESTKDKVVDIVRDPELNITTCDGIEIIGIEYSKVALRDQKTEDILLENYTFVKYGEPFTEKTTLTSALKIMCEIILQNCPGIIRELAVCEINETTKGKGLMAEVKKILMEQPLVESTFLENKYDQLKRKQDIILINEGDFPQKNGKKITDVLSEQGFIIYKGSEIEFEKMDLEIVIKCEVEASSIFLLRLFDKFCEKPVVIEVSNEEFGWMDKLKDYIENKNCTTVYLVTQNDKLSGVSGLVECLMRERSDVVFRAISLESNHCFSIETDFYRKQLQKNLTLNILKNDNWGTYIHLPFDEVQDKETENASVSMSTAREFSSLKWVENPLNLQRCYPGSQLAYVFYSAVNQLDLMYATGRLHNYNTAVATDPEVLLGYEYSGISSAKRIMGLLEFGALSLQVHTDPEYTWEIPEVWSLQDAATVPLVNAMAYYGLVSCGGVQPESSVLVHPGTNCISFAAISIALNMGCDVFTATNTLEEKQILKRYFPTLNDDNIGLLNDKSLERILLKNTKKGVDLILITEYSEIFESSLFYLMKCHTNIGSIVEFGSAEFSSAEFLKKHSSDLINNCSFHSVMPEILLKAESKVKKKIHGLITEGIKNGMIRPLPRRVFSETHIEEAFRYVESTHNIEKTLIKIRDEHPIECVERRIKALPRITFDGNKSYVILEGMTDFGLELANWMIKKGTKKLVLNSKTGTTNGFQSFCLNKWRKFKDVTVEVDNLDVTVEECAGRIISNARRLGPVGGIFNVAVAPSESSSQKQTSEVFEEVFRQVFLPAQNIDKVSRKHCPGLDYFVILSSLSSERGNSGQESYGMACSAVEKLCERRKENSLPALAVQFGPIQDDPNDTGGCNGLLKQYLQPQCISSSLMTLEKFMLQSNPVMSSTAVLSKTTRTSEQSQTPAAVVASILGIKDWSIVDKSLSMVQLGMDSLMTYEVKASLQKSFQVNFNAKQIGELTFGYLMGLSENSI